MKKDNSTQWFREFRLKSARKGFTLLELMVIVAIVGLVASMAFAYFAGTPRERLKAVTRDIVSLMLSAKVNANKTGTIWYVQFDTGSPEKIMLYDSGIDNDVNPAADVVQKTVELKTYRGVSFGSGYGKDDEKETYTKMDGEEIEFAYDSGTDSVNDGITVSGNRFVFDPDGAANTDSLGAVYVKVASGDTMVVERMTAAGMIKVRRNFDGNWTE